MNLGVKIYVDPVDFHDAEFQRLLTSTILRHIEVPGNSLPPPPAEMDHVSQRREKARIYPADPAEIKYNPALSLQF